MRSLWPQLCLTMNIRGYRSRIALAEPVIGRAFARPVGSLVRDDGDRFDFQTANSETVVAQISDTTPHSRGARRPRFARTVRASENRGRRESRVANAPAASRAK